MGRELPSNLVRRGSRIWVRKEVPKDVRAAYGKAVVFESTGHADDKLGRAAGLARLAELEAEWAEIRAGKPRRPSTPADRQRAAHDLYARELADDERTRLALPTAEQLEVMRARAVNAPPQLHRDIEAAPDGAPLRIMPHVLDFIAARGAADYDHDRRSRLLRELRRHLGSGETALVADMADEVVRRDRLAAPPGSLPWRELCRDLTRAWIGALEAQKARDGGDYTHAPRDPILTAPAVPVAPPGETIMELYDKLAKLNPANLKADTFFYGRPIIQTFVDTLPPNSPASAITKKAVREWFDALAAYPKKAGDMTLFRGMTFPQVLAHNATLTEPKPSISRRTCNKYLASLGGLCSWLVKRGHLDDNPTAGLGFADEENSPRRPYTVPKLCSIFASPVYTGFKADRREHLPGDLRTRDWRFWLPLLGLYTGARLGELAQLLTADVRCEAGAWVLYITAEGDDAKSLKTAGSRRVVPVHAELIRLGFLDHHAALVAAGEPRMWPEITPDARGHVSGVPSTWWRKYMLRVGLKTDGSTTYHSFRHGLADELRRVGYADAEIGFILGHADDKTTTTRGYGILSQGNLARRVEMMGKVEFPGLDLSHL